MIGSFANFVSHLILLPDNAEKGEMRVYVTLRGGKTLMQNTEERDSLVELDMDSKIITNVLDVPPT
jgi:hypothetical protein